MPELNERYKAMLGQQYDASDHVLALERARARQLAIEFSKYCGTYLSLLNKHDYEQYKKIRKQFLPNLSETCIIDHGFHVDYGKNIYGGINGMIGFNCTILDSVRVIIGNDVYIGSSVVITDASHPVSRQERTVKHGTISKPITIGNGVWICSNATICQGVTIGDNSIIGAGAVIRHDVPANCMAVGNEGKVITFNTEQHEQKT